MSRLNLAPAMRRAGSSIWFAIVQHPDLFQDAALIMVAVCVSWLANTIFDACSPVAYHYWARLIVLYPGFGHIANFYGTGLALLFRWCLYPLRWAWAGSTVALNILRPVCADFRDGMIGTRIANALVLPVLRALRVVVGLTCAAVYGIFVLATSDRSYLADISRSFFTEGYHFYIYAMFCCKVDNQCFYDMNVEPFVADRTVGLTCFATIYAMFCCIAPAVYIQVRRHNHDIIARLDGPDAYMVAKQIACFVLFALKVSKLYPIGNEGFYIHVVEALVVYFAAATEHHYILYPSTVFSMYMAATTCFLIVERCTIWGASASTQPAVWILLTISSRLAILISHENSRWDYLLDEITSFTNKRETWGIFAQLLMLPTGYYSRTTEWNWETLKTTLELTPEDQFFDEPRNQFRVLREQYYGLPDGFLKACREIYGESTLIIISISEIVKSLIWVGFAMLIGSIVSHLEQPKNEQPVATKLHLVVVTIMLGLGYITFSGLTSRCRLYSKMTVRGGVLSAIFDRLVGLSTAQQHLAEDIELVTTRLAAFLDALDNRLALAFKGFQVLICCRTLWHHSGMATVLVALFLGGLTYSILEFIRQNLHVRTHLEERAAASAYAINDFLGKSEGYMMAGDLPTVEKMLIVLEEREIAAMARVNEFDVLRNAIGAILCSLLIALGQHGWYGIRADTSSTASLGGMFECFALLIITTAAIGALFEQLVDDRCRPQTLDYMRRFFDPTPEEEAAGPKIDQLDHLAARAAREQAETPRGIIDMARLDCLVHPIGFHSGANDGPFRKPEICQHSIEKSESTAEESSSSDVNSEVATSSSTNKPESKMDTDHSATPKPHVLQNAGEATPKPDGEEWPQTWEEFEKERLDKRRWLGTSLLLKRQPRGKRRTRLAPAPLTADDSSGDERPEPKFFNSYDGGHDAYVRKKHVIFEDLHPVRFTAGEDIGIMYNFDLGKHFRTRRGILYAYAESDIRVRMDLQAGRKLERRLKRRKKRKDRKDGRRIIREMRVLRKDMRILEKEQKKKSKERRREKARLIEARKLETPEERKVRKAEKKRLKKEAQQAAAVKSDTSKLSTTSLHPATPRPTRKVHPALPFRPSLGYDAMTSLGKMGILPTIHQPPIMARITLIPQPHVVIAPGEGQSPIVATAFQSTSSNGANTAAHSTPPTASPTAQDPSPTPLPATVTMLEQNQLHNSGPQSVMSLPTVTPSIDGHAQEHLGSDHEPDSRTTMEANGSQAQSEPKNKGKGPALPAPSVEPPEPSHSQHIRLHRPPLHGSGEGPSTPQAPSTSPYNHDVNDPLIYGSDSDFDSDGTAMPDSFPQEVHYPESTALEDLPFDAQEKFPAATATSQNACNGLEGDQHEVAPQVQQDYVLATHLAAQELAQDKLRQDKQARDLEKRIAEACRQEQIDRGAQLVERLRLQASQRLDLESRQKLAPGRLQYVPVGIVPKTYIPVVEPDDTVNWELADFAMIYQGVYHSPNRPPLEPEQPNDSHESSSRMVVTASGQIIDATLEDDQMRVEMAYNDMAARLPSERSAKRGQRVAVKERECLYDGSVGTRPLKRRQSSQERKEKKKAKRRVDKEREKKREMRRLFDMRMESHALVHATLDRMKVLHPPSRKDKKGKKRMEHDMDYDDIDVMTSMIDTMKISNRRPPKVDKYGGYGDPDWTDSSADSGSDSSVLSSSDESSEDETEPNGRNGGNGGGGGSGGDGGSKPDVKDELADDYILPTTAYTPPKPKSKKSKTVKKSTGGKKAAADAIANATPATEAITTTKSPTATKGTGTKKSAVAKKGTGGKKAVGTGKAGPAKRARFANTTSFKPEKGIHGPSRAPGDPIPEFNQDDDGDYGDDGSNVFVKWKDLEELEDVPPVNMKSSKSPWAEFHQPTEEEKEKEEYKDILRDFGHIPDDMLEPVKESLKENVPVLVSVNNATIAPKPGERAILEDVNMNIQAKSITSVGGMPATGKTTLIRTLMGRTYVESGQVTIADGVKIAYAGQNSWFKTAPYRENVIGQPDFDSDRMYTWYIQVMGACMLLDKAGYENEDDMAPVEKEEDKPDNKERQRVALARAIFSEPDLLLLDDPFSDQDEAAAEILFKQLLAPGGLLPGKMAIFITSSDSRTFTRVADNVYMIKKTVESQIGPRLVTRMKGSRARHQSVKFWERAEWIPDETRTLESPVAPILESTAGNMMRNHVLLNEAHPRGPLVTWTQVWKHGDPHRPFLCAALVLLAGCCDCFGPALIALLGNHPAVLRRVLVLGVLSKLMGIALYCVAAWMFFMTVVPRALRDVSTNLIIACTQSAKVLWDGPERTHLGGLLLITLRIVKTKLPIASFNTCVLASQLLCTTVIGATASLFLVPVLCLCLAGAARFAQAVSLLQSEFDPIRERVGSQPTRLHFAETLQSLEQMQHMMWYRAHDKWSSRFLKLSQKLFLLEESFHSWKETVSRIWIMLTWFLVVAVGLFMNSSPHAFGITLLMLLQATWTFPLLVSSCTDYYHAMMSMGQLLHRIENVPRRDLDTEEEPPAWWPNSRRVDFDNVTVYTEGTDGKCTAMIRNLTFSMVYRHHHAFYDEPDNRGAALHRALCKIVPYEGIIKFGGLDIKKIPLRRLLQYVQAIPGSPAFVPGTIRQNLVPSELLKPPRDPQRLQAIIDQILIHMGLQNIMRDTSFLMRDVPLTADQQLRFMAAKALMLFYLRQQAIVFEDNLSSNCGKWSRRVVLRAFNEIYRMQGRLILSDEPYPVHQIPLVGFISEFSGEVALCKQHRNPEPFYLKGGPVYESD